MRSASAKRRPASSSRAAMTARQASSATAWAASMAASCRPHPRPVQLEHGGQQVGRQVPVAVEDAGHLGGVAAELVGEAGARDAVLGEGPVHQREQPAAVLAVVGLDRHQRELLRGVGPTIGVHSI